ncbi:MAG: CCA tRNA nucleotidyltransferase [Candidatus Aenigmatarchaeota archaeon]
MDTIRNRVLQKIKPSKAEENEIKEFIINLIRVAKTITDTEPVIVGSIGRGTWLSGDHDIDLFLMFPKSVSRDMLEKRGIKYAKKIVKVFEGRYVIKYAEHPYLHAKINGKTVDIVPCYRIKKGEKILSAVDRSPLHIEYIISRLDPSLKDDARLLKQFCKGIGIYGSDAKRSGLSGYACELLIIHHGTFESVLKSVSKYKPGHIIDIEGLWPKDPKAIRKRFENAPLILIDPVDKNRNVTAALSHENFVKFVNKAEEYLNSPDIRFFFPIKKELSLKEIKKLQDRKTKFLGILFDKPDIIDDILYPQLRKALERLDKLLNYNEFKTLRKYEFVLKNKVILIFEVEEWTPPAIEKKIGPSIFATKNSKDFLKKYENALYGPYIEKGLWVVEKKRVFTRADMLLKTFLNRDYDKLLEDGIPNYIAKNISKSKILEHEKLWGLIKKKKALSVFLREKYFENLKI